MEKIEEIKNRLDVAAVVVDQDGFIIFVNKQFEVVFGWGLNEIIGKPLTLIIPRNLHDAHHLGFSRFLATEKATVLQQALSLRAVTKDGKEFLAEHYITAAKDQGKWVFAATIRPLLD